MPCVQTKRIQSKLKSEMKSDDNGKNQSEDSYSKKKTHIVAAAIQQRKRLTG